MDALIRTHMDALRSEDKQLQGDAFQYLIAATESPVDWAYEVWDELLESLRHKDNRVRAIAAQILCNLAKSDPMKRMVKDVHALLAVTRDERFVTARHCMQSLWKVGAAGERQRRVVLDGLANRYAECADEKNCTLIRYDIIESMRKIYDATADGQIPQRASELIAKEADLKYRKKYSGLWKR